MTGRRAQQGFTLFELVLVVWIIGILASIAIPAYQDYIVRARVIEGLQLAVPLEQAISHYYDRWGALPKDNATIGLPPAQTLRGASVESMEVSGGIIAIRYSAALVYTTDPPLLVLLPATNRGYATGSLLWTCGRHAVADGFQQVPGPAPKTSIPNKYLPASCRN